MCVHLRLIIMHIVGYPAPILLRPWDFCLLARHFITFLVDCNYLHASITFGYFLSCYLAIYHQPRLEYQQRENYLGSCKPVQGEFVIWFIYEVYIIPIFWNVFVNSVRVERKLCKQQLALNVPGKPHVSYLHK
jgi:hypothetical protein